MAALFSIYNVKAQVFVSPHPQHLLFLVFFLLLLLFLINNHPDECKGLSHCGLIYISLVINDAEYLFMC